jgi:hypothetical protein
MARGGFRPGSGRKPKIRADAAPTRFDAETPLEYLLAVMRDPNAPAERTDRAAQVAAPFCHARAAGTPSSYNYVPKRDEAAKRARWAGYGSSWWGLLRSAEECAALEAELDADPELKAWVQAEARRSNEEDLARFPQPEPEVAVKAETQRTDQADQAPRPKAKAAQPAKAAENARWARYLSDDEPPTDWTDPSTGATD